MMKKLKSNDRYSLTNTGSFFHCAFLLLFWALGPAFTLPTCTASASSKVEILTPQSGARVFARNPETHLILRQSGEGTQSWVRVEKTGAKLDPIVSMEGEEYTYLHFRLPLTPGMNRFTIQPAGQRLELNFQRQQSDLDLRSRGKDISFFHRSDRLPESCEECHELRETETIEPVGMQKQISCATCHKTIVNKGTWKHGPTVNQQCLSCHLQSVRPWRIGLPAAKIKDICIACHTSKKAWFTRKVPHGPLNVGGCTLCHDPHGENNRYQLWAEGSMTLCITCHSDKQKLVSRKKEERVPFVHGIISGMGCIACHDPHATDNLFVLKKPINELCTSCHTFLAGISRGHPVDRHPLSGRKDPRRPGRELACTGCHDPHGSSYQHLLIQTPLGGRLCRECHNK